MKSDIINQERIKKLTLRAQIMKLMVFSFIMLADYYSISLLGSMLDTCATNKNTPPLLAPLIIITGILMAFLIIEVNLSATEKRKIKNWLKNLSTENPHLTRCLFQIMNKLGYNNFSLIPTKQVPFLHLFFRKDNLIIIYNPEIFSQLTAEEVKNALAYKVSYFKNKHHLEMRLFRLLIEILAINIMAIALPMFAEIICITSFAFLFLALVCAALYSSIISIIIGAIGYYIILNLHQILDEAAAIQITQNPQAFISMIKKATWAEYYKKSPDEPLKIEEVDKLAEESSILKNRIERIEENFLL